MSSRVANSHTAPLLGALLRLASQFTSEKFSRWIESSGFRGVQPAHSAAIQPLWERREGARITELARASRMTKQSMSALVADLEVAGYIERVKDPNDARATRVRLTAHGRSYARAVRAFSRSLETDWAQRIGSQRIEELCATLELLRTTVFLASE
jgi:DNA-binding MarR family transcriptional regulator